MFKKISNLGIWKKYFIVIFTTIVISFLINRLLFLPISSKVDNNAWLQYWGSVIGSLIAGLVTLWGIEYTIRGTLMNVRPFIRPISSKYYIYYKENDGVVMTSKDILYLIEDYYTNIEMETDELEMFIVDSAYNKVLEDNKGRKWQKEIENINFDYLKNQIIEICKYNNGRDAFLNLYRNIERLDNTGCNEKIIEEILYNMRENYIEKIANRVICQEKMKWYIFLPVYNVGAGNAIDISFNWSFKDGSYKEILNKIGFNDKDYARINKSFSLDKIMNSKADILLNINGENKVYIPIAGELILLIKHILVKIQSSKADNIVNKDDLHVNYNKIAELHIKCKDIHGELNKNDYSVFLRMYDGIEKKYGYVETYVDLKFETHGIN